MISRALDREISDFVELLNTHLARLIHTGHSKTKHLPRAVREEVLRDALVVAWRRREHIDPLNEPISVWFERCVYVARTEKILPDSDELEVLSKLSPAPPATDEATPKAKMPVGEASGSSGTDATVKLGKECPPCWRCRYFDGWLPKRRPYGPDWKPKDELDLVCKTIDERKVEIAKFVQGAYDPALLED